MGQYKIIHERAMIHAAITILQELVHSSSEAHAVQVAVQALTLADTELRDKLRGQIGLEG